MHDDVAARLREALAGREPALISVRDVAKALGVSVTAVYRQVDSIEEVRRLLAPPPARPDSSRAFTEAFLARAAGPKRIARIVTNIVGDKLEIGPLDVGPKSVNAVASARGVVGKVVARARGPVAVRVDVPVDLDVDITIGRNYHRRVGAWLQLPLLLDLEASDDLVLRVRPRKPRPQDIAVTVAPAGASLYLIRRIGRMDTLLRKHALEYLDDVLASPEASAAMAIDLGRVIDDAWHRGLVFE